MTELEKIYPSRIPTLWKESVDMVGIQLREIRSQFFELKIDPLELVVWFVDERPVAFHKKNSKSFYILDKLKYTVYASLIIGKNLNDYNINLFDMDTLLMTLEQQFKKIKKIVSIPDDKLDEFLSIHDSLGKHRNSRKNPIKILQCLRYFPFSSMTDLTQKLRWSSETIRKHLNKYIVNGLVKKERRKNLDAAGYRRSMFHYSLTNKGKKEIS